MEAINIPTNLVEYRNTHIEETLERNRSKLFGFIRKRVPSVEDAEDIFQDVSYQFINGFDAIDSIERASGWLFSVARNKIADMYRKKKPVSLEGLYNAENDEGQPLSLSDILPDLSNMLEDTMARDIIWESLLEALETLPEAQRQVFVWHELEKKSFREMSELTGDSINTLLSRKRYAIMTLRKSLQELYNDITGIDNE